MKGRDRTGRDGTGQDRTGQDRIGWGAQASLKVNDIDIYEINEAFASQASHFSWGLQGSSDEGPLSYGF